MDKKEKHHIIQEIESTLTKYRQQVPTENYLSLVKEYRDVCIKLNKLLAKEKDRNRKFVYVKRKLIEDHTTEMREMNAKVSDYRRIIEKYKSIMHKKSSSTVVTHKEKKYSDDDSIQNIQQDIDEIIEKFFSGDNIREILDEIINNLTAPNSYFDFQKINLTTFDTHKIQVLQRAIYKVVMKKIETDSTSVVSAITNTILRKQFQYLHTQFAKKVLKASNIQRGVFKFFGDVFVEQSNGQRWNSFAITRFMKEYSEENIVLVELQTKLDGLQGQLKELTPILNKLELESSNEYYEVAKQVKKFERLIHREALHLSEEQIKFSDLKEKYDELLFAVTKTLLEKRRVINIKVD